MKKKWKIIVGVIIAAAVIIFAALQYTQGIEAKLLEVQPRSIAKTFQEEGIVVSNEEYPIYTTNGGKIIDLPVKEGQVVKKGELLVQFDARELHYQLAQLEGQLKSIKAQQELEKDKISLEKMQQLYEAGAISLKEYEDARNAVNSQYYPGQIETLNAQISLVEYKLEESSVYSPDAGIVTHCGLKNGMIVVPGQLLLTLMQKEDYLVEVYVLTEDASKIDPGMTVELVQDNKDKNIVFLGQVEKIAPTAVERTSALGLIEQRIKVTVKPDIPPGLNLRPGYALDMNFTTQKQEARLVVPKTTIFPYQDGDALWVVRDNKAAIQPVVKGFENDREVVIENGLNAGDMVILNPQLEGLEEGKKIAEK